MAAGVAMPTERGLLLTALLLLCACDHGPSSGAVGTLERDRIAVVAEQPEPIVELAVAEGSVVAAGEVIARLDSRRAEARLRQAEAGVAATQARLDELLRGSRREDVDRARAELAAADAALIERRPAVERVRKLVADGVVSQSELDAAEAAYARAEAERQAMHSNLERLLNGATVEELDQAKARLAEVGSAAERARLDLERLTLSAPRAGTVEALPFELGETPPAGVTVAVLLAGEAPYARVYVPAQIRPQVAVGDPATVRIDGYEQAFRGRVRTISAEAAFTPYFALTERDRGHLTYLAEVDLVDEAAAALPTGLPVEVEF